MKNPHDTWWLRQSKKAQYSFGDLPRSRSLFGAAAAYVLLGMAPTGCNSGSSSHRTATPPPSTEAADSSPAVPTQPPQTGVAKAALPTDPVGIYTLIDAAVVSTFSTTDQHGAPSFAPAQLAQSSPAFELAQSAECTDSATPKDALSGVPFPPVHKDFAAGRFYCLMTSNTYNANSIPGAYAEARSVLCLINKVLPGGGSGKAITVPVDFADENCFSDDFRATTFPDGLPAPSTAVVTASKPAGVAPDKWDSSIVVTMNAAWGGGGTLTLLFATRQNSVATAALLDRGAEHKESYSFSLDTASGILRADVRAYQWNDGDQNKNMHSRIKTQGAVGADGKFTKLTHFEGVDALAFNMDPDKEIRLHAFRMDFANGGQASHRYCATSGGCTDVFDITKYGASVANPACYHGDGGADGCTGVTPISFTANTDIDFALIPGGPRLQAPDALIKTGPLGFTAVTSADIEP